MRIGIDARLAGTANGGIGRYIEELIRALLAEKNDHTWIIFLEKKSQLSWLIETSRIKVVVAPVRHYTLREQLVMPFIFYREKLDVLHVPHFNVPLLYFKPFVVTIHDLLWHEIRDPRATTLSPFMHSLKYTGYRLVVNLAVRRAKNIIVPTIHVRQIVEKFSHKKIAVIQDGVTETYLLSRGAKLKKEIPNPFILCLGSLYPHKNLSLVLDAMSDFPTLNLVIVSGRSIFANAFLSQVERRGIRDRVHMLGHIPDEQIVSLFQQTVALVFPSLSEGFGLPGLEAMAVGAPVLASDIPVFHEVYRDGALFFDPHSKRSLVNAITAIQKDSALRADLQTKGKAVAKTYSWQKMAQQILKIYEQS